MVEKKKYYKQKLQEKKIEILKTIIEEEIDLLTEDVESHGLAKFTDRRNSTGMLLSPVVDIANAVLHGSAKGATQLVGIAGLLIGGTIAGLLPFNNPKTINYIAKKIQYLEQENLKGIDKQFEKELAQMHDGWETFKTDFWGIGFVVSPINAIAAIATAEKGLDMGLSVLNVVSGGKVGQIIDKMDEDIKDPGSLKDFLGKSEKTDEKEAQQRVESQIESERCFKNLQQPGFLDPGCIGIDQRDKFASGPRGTSAYIKFIQNNLYNYNNKRKERFGTEFPGQKYRGAFAKDEWGSTDNTRLTSWLKSNGYISESSLEEGLAQKVTQALTDQRPQTGIRSLNSLHKKIDEWVKQGKVTTNEAKEFFNKIKNSSLGNPQVKQAANKWSAVNTAKMMTNIFTTVNNDIATGKAGKVSPQEIQAYKAEGPRMVSEIFKSLSKKSKKFKPVPTQAALKAAQQAVTASMTKMPNQSVSVQPQPAKPQVAAPPQPQQPTPTTTKSR